jgi:hypothetical protein
VHYQLIQSAIHSQSLLNSAMNWLIYTVVCLFIFCSSAVVVAGMQNNSPHRINTVFSVPIPTRLNMAVLAAPVERDAIGPPGRRWCPNLNTGSQASELPPRATGTTATMATTNYRHRGRPFTSPVPSERICANAEAMLLVSLCPWFLTGCAHVWHF